MRSLYSHLQPVIKSAGYTLWWVQWLQGNTLQVFIDSEKTIGIEDCEKVSRQLSAWLDVYDKTINAPSQYNLQVSSPGTDRTLFIPEHYQRYLGEKVCCFLHRAIDGRRRISGKLANIDDQGITLLVTNTAKPSDFSEKLQYMDFLQIKRSCLVYDSQEDLQRVSTL